MNIVKPKSIFSLLKENITFKVDTPSIEIGGLTLLESSILVSLLKILKAKYIFEFGTYLGSTTKLSTDSVERLPMNSLACGYSTLEGTRARLERRPERKAGRLSEVAHALRSPLRYL